MNTTIAQILTNGEIEYLEYDFEGRKRRRKGKPMDLEIAKENLLLLKSVFDKHNIAFWLIYGTCLGAVRDGNFIGHDTDTDIGVFMRDKDKIIAAIPELQNLGLEPIRTKCPGDLLSLMRNDEYIDVGFFQRGRKAFFMKCWFYQSNRVYGNHYDRFDTISFLGEEFLIPQNVEKMLEAFYGKNWRTPVKDLPARSPYSFTILRKIYGRMKRYLNTRKEDCCGL